MKKIYSIKIVKEIDYYPDLSYLGEYSDKPENGSIDREEQEGSLRCGEYRYFNPCNYDLSDSKRDIYALQDYKRMEDYNKGNWGCIGIYAKCEYQIQVGNNKFFTIHYIQSAGLWGIESDSDESYFIEIAEEECNSLIGCLKEIGFTEDEIIPEIEKAMEMFKDDL